jgi:hypothetical protein
MRDDGCPNVYHGEDRLQTAIAAKVYCRGLDPGMPPKRFRGPMPSWWDNFLRRRQIRACRGEAEFGLARLASSTTSGGYGPKPIAKWPFVTPFLRGTESSNPPLSRRESTANLTAEDVTGQHDRREFVERSAPRATLAGLLLLCRCECRGSPHLLTLGLGAAPALRGSGADKVA